MFMFELIESALFFLATNSVATIELTFKWQSMHRFDSYFVFVHSLPLRIISDTILIVRTDFIHGIGQCGQSSCD